MSEPKRVLVLRHGALGDFILTLGCFRTLRAVHGDAHMVLLTTPPFAALGDASGYFDEVWVDTRPKLWHPGRWWRLIRKLRGGRFDRVYDLQRKQRTTILYHLMKRRDLEWSGVVPGCTFFQPDDRNERRHIQDKLTAQLAIAGIDHVQPPDLSWLTGHADRFTLRPPYALVVPGSAPHRPEKRLPPATYAEVCRAMAAVGIRPVLIGTRKEAEDMDAIAREAPRVRNLCDQTTFGDLGELARGALFAVGNDTGPMHLIAAAGCASLVIFSFASDPVKVAPRGRHVRVFQRQDLNAVRPEALARRINLLLEEDRDRKPTLRLPETEEDWPHPL